MFTEFYKFLNLDARDTLKAMERGLSRKGKDILKLLAGGAILEFRRSPGGYFRASGKDRAVWTKHHRKTLLYAIRSLHSRGLIEINEKPEGVTSVSVTDSGKRFARRQESVLGGTPPEPWDKKWRLVFFDIPEQKKKFRDAFRYQLRKAGLVEFQRSGFIFPFPCFREVEELARQLNLAEHVTFVTAETLSNEFHFKNFFGLS